MIRIEGVGFDAIQARYRFASKNTSTISKPALVSIAEHLKDSVQEELDGGLDWRGFNYTGKLKRSVRTFNVSENEVDVLQDEEGNFIMYGTTPNYTNKPHPRLVEWAQSKLGLNRREAFAVGWSILQHGILSRNRTRYPMGNRGFNYPEYVVEIKEKDYLEKAGESIAGLIVRYLDTEAGAPDLGILATDLPGGIWGD